MYLSKISSRRGSFERMLIFGAFIGQIVLASVGVAQEASGDEAIEERKSELIDRLWEQADIHPNEALETGAELKRLLKEHPAPDTLMRAETILAAIYRRLGQFDKGLEAASHAVSLSEQLDMPEATILALKEKAVIYNNVGKPYLGMEVVDEALALAEAIGENLRRANLLHLKGMLYKKLGDYPKALENVLEARKQQLEAGREDLAAYSGNSLGILFLEMGDSEAALEYHLKNKAYWENTEDVSDLAVCYANLGDVYRAKGDYEEALAYHKLSLEIEQESKNLHGEVGSLLDIGGVYYDQGRYAEAEASAHEGLALNETLGSSYYVISGERLLGKALAGRGNVKEAMDHLDRALEQARKVDSHVEVRDLILEKSRLYSRQGKWAEALAYYKEYHQWCDKILDAQKVRSIAELQERYQSEAKAREIELLRAQEAINQLNLEKQEQDRKQLLQEKKNEHILRWVLISGIVVLVGGILGLVYILLQKQLSESRLRRSNEEVTRQKKQLEGQKRQIEATNGNLRELNERLQQLNQALEQSPVSVMVTDIQGKILYVNDKFCRVSGYTQDEVLGCQANILKSGNMSDEVYRTLWTMVLKGQVWSGELENRKKGGALFWERVTVAPILGEDGSIVRLLGVKEDITQEKAHEEETQRSRMQAQVAEASDKAKSVFLKAVGQDMRTPLNSILGFCNLLAQDQMDKEQLKYLNQIGQSGFQLLTLIDKILDFTSAESGTMVFVEELFKPELLAQNVHKQFLSRAAERNIELNIDTDGLEEDSMVGDEKRIRQVLDILVDNAIKFTNEGTVSIKLKSRAIEEFGQIELIGEVEDTGIGMSPGQIKDLFKPFSTGITKTHKSYGHTGLGLALCHRICSLLGGRIEVSSKMEQGSVFSFVVKTKPASKIPEEEPNENEVPEGENLARAFPLRIMVAEDNRVNRRLVETMMERLGYAVTFAVDGTEVLSELRKGSFDIIFMDLQMPNMSGVEATRRIRSGDLGEAHRDIYVVAVTAFASDDMRQACEEVNMQAFVPKPFDLDIIKEQIVKAYQVKQMKK